jgi:hypothetical protein
MISQFDDLVWQAVDTYPAPLGISRDQWFTLINSIIQKESSFKPDAVSWTGAGIGLMQVNPNIWLNVYNVTREQLFDPWINIQVGIQIAQNYIRQYGTSAGLGAYFAGPTNRLSYAARFYAQTVLSFYQKFIAKMRGSFTTSMPKPGEYWFVEPISNDGIKQNLFVDSLPEDGELAPGDSFIQANESQYSDQSDIWPLMVGAGIAFLIWQNQ